MNMTPFVVIWSFLALAVLGLAFYRKLVSMREDDYIHLAGGAAKLIPQQVAMAHKLDIVDRWGKTLTIITAIGGLMLAAAYLYQLWLESLQPLG
jgi:hypothetical protein